MTIKVFNPSFEMRLHFFHRARFLFISLQITPKLLKTELSALFVPGPDLQKASEWEKVPSRKVIAFSLQTCFQFTLLEAWWLSSGFRSPCRQELGSKDTDLTAGRYVYGD